MRRFQVELLHAEGLPLYLLDSLSAVFESSDLAMRAAAEAHRNQLAKNLEYVRGKDYSSILAECEYWLELFKNRQHKPQQLDPKTYRSLGSQIEAYEEAYRLLNHRFFSLAAIGLLETGASREEIVRFLDRQSWATKHEVITRWGWMKRHDLLLKEGKALPAPYSCSLAPRGEAGEHDDEEFYQLLSFLHLLRFETGKELLFFEKGETPDFILEDQSGKLVGAEMAQAWVSPSWTKEHIAATQVLKGIFEILSHLGVHAHIETPPSWRRLREKLPRIAEWVVSEVVDLEIPISGIVLQNRDLNLKIELRITEGQSCITHGGVGPKGLDTAKHSRAMQSSLQERLRKKVQGPEPIRKPCYLVIYPYHGVDVNLENVVGEFLRHPALDVSSHFSEVWLSSEARIIRIV